MFHIRFPFRDSLFESFHLYISAHSEHIRWAECTTITALAEENDTKRRLPRNDRIHKRSMAWLPTMEIKTRRALEANSLPGMFSVQITFGSTDQDHEVASKHLGV